MIPKVARSRFCGILTLIDISRWLRNFTLPWCIAFYHSTILFQKLCIQALCKFRSCLRCIGGLRSWKSWQRTRMEIQLNTPSTVTNPVKNNSWFSQIYTYASFKYLLQVFLGTCASVLNKSDLSWFY